MRSVTPRLFLVAPLWRAGTRGGPTAPALPREGQHTGEAGISLVWGRGFILQAAAAEAPTASASTLWVFLLLFQLWLSHPASQPSQSDRIHPVLGCRWVWSWDPRVCAGKAAGTAEGTGGEGGAGWLQMSM